MNNQEMKIEEIESFDIKQAIYLFKRYRNLILLITFIFFVGSAIFA